MSVRKVAALVVAAIAGWCGASAMAAPVVPVLRGIYDPGTGAPLQALWGYDNPNPTSMFVTVGSQNFFSPGAANRGQVTMFLPGTVYGAFVTALDGSPLTWTLMGSSATASGGATLSVDPTVLTKAGEVVPFVKGVWEYGPDDYAAVFGYASGEAEAVMVPLGANNVFSPGTAFRGQPTTFLPGVFDDAFVVHFQGPSLTWSLASGGNTATATADGSSPRLAFDPLPEPGSVSLIGVAVAGGLVRRRRTRTAA